MVSGLIEESGANFDADIVKPFSNKPTFRREERREEEAPRAPRPADLTASSRRLRNSTE